MIRHLLLGALLLLCISAGAQRWEDPIQITTIFEHAFSNKQLQEAYAFCDKDSMGDYENFRQQYGSIATMQLTDMAAPTDFEKLSTATIQASGQVTDAQRGNGEYAIIFRFQRTGNSKEWKVIALELTLEKASREEVTDMTEATPEATPAIGAVAATEDDATTTSTPAADKPKLKLMKVYNSPDKKYKLYVYTVLRQFAMPGDGGTGNRMTHVVLKNAQGKKIGESNEEGDVLYDEISVEWQKEEVDFAKARSINLKTGKFEY